MELEEKKVLLGSRINFIANRKKKEWWYTGVSDPQSGVYFSFSLIRIALIDNFHFAMFDPKFDKPFEFEWKGYIDAENPAGRLSLSHHSEGCTFQLLGSAEEGWRYELRAPTVSFALESKPTIPAFTKYDEKFDDEYALLHFFQNCVNGMVETPLGKYEMTNALSYCDHCFGSVPKHSRWHWIAVQNANCAIASLMNYGGLAQCYTEAYLNCAEPVNACKRWIRLDQDVSFESTSEHHFEHPWQVTSPDMDLTLQIQMRCYSQERIPPLFPFLLSIDHSECFVKVFGKIRVDGTWIDTGTMYGVLEEHHGTW